LKYFIIPLFLLIFVFIYPFVEYMVDCPSAVDDPVANNDCTFTKHTMWVAVAHLSLTEYGFPPDTLLNFDVTENPDAAESWNYIPMMLVTAVVAGIEKVKSRRTTYNFD
jgi:hypothetical protein